ncbi:MAG TPA: hypothetical protein DEG06_01795 [Lachnospiraceae bacterium]|jgi:hypothetical protein|nr:hypothetical protein [Lachnospiraceae bacterium]HBY70950.1 hypothetical protein [Lachnospiraceae bacterium]HCA68971.1 hypothetical protein [Lachnospiraceae bacterium]HCM12893.1 hypothetical protein [Lachnospiraceae bacterium]HCR41492.1 hypothetical protein [Lachnospiraceae bacterium]
MREEKFKMERHGLVKVNDVVEITERPGQTSYSYIIEPAVAMSGCIPLNNPIKSKKGIVKELQHTHRGYYVIVEFDE